VTTVRLNIGAGETPIPGFVSIDAKNGDDAGRLPYPDGSVDEVYSSHCLEHIHHSKTFETVREWARVLKPGGRIRIAVPDYDRVLERFRAGRMSAQELAAWMHGGRDDDLDRHRAFLTRDLLTEAMRHAGIDHIRDFEPEHEDCTRLPLSMNLEGFKRAITIRPRPKVVMCLSAPRIFGFKEFHHSMEAVARELGWDLRDWGTTEWGRGLTFAAVQALGDGADYIMFLDYDSVFTADDCRELLRIMQENPHIAALYPVEAHRHQDLPLGFNAIMPADYRRGDEVTAVQSGHFGCTIVRREVFESIPQPWFMTLPNTVTLDMADKGGLDADIYFWFQLRAYGFQAYQANRVQIGHQEMCVKWCGENGIIWQPIQNWRKHGKPKGATFNPDVWLEKVGKKRPLERAPVELEDSRPPGLRASSPGYPERNGRHEPVKQTAEA